MNEGQVDKVKENVTKNVKKLRDIADAFRSGLGIPERIKWRDRVGDFQKQRLQPQQGRNQNQRGIPAPPQVQERFSSRPRLIDFFMKSQEPSQPQQPVQEELSAEEILILNEHRRDLLSRAKAREEEEKREQQRIEDAKARERYEKTMSVENL